MPNHSKKQENAGPPKVRTRKRPRPVYSLKEAFRLLGTTVPRQHFSRLARRAVFALAASGITDPEIASVIEISEAELLEEFKSEIKLGVLAYSLGLHRALRARATGRGGLRPHVGAARYLRQELNRLGRLDSRDAKKRVT